jgi:hypothetical protein
MKEESRIDFTDVREKLRAYLMELIMHFRERMKSLPIEVQTVASKTLNDFSFPCQMIVIWTKEPEFQIIVIAHLKEMEDKTIEIYGPIEKFEFIRLH